MQEYCCIVYVEAYSDSKSGEKWIQSDGACGQWAHEDCTPGIGVYERMSHTFVIETEVIRLRQKLVFVYE